MTRIVQTKKYNKKGIAVYQQHEFNTKREAIGFQKSLAIDNELYKLERRKE
ncbi:TPA: hypothetical protein ACGOY6_001319 [Streptococcus suis]